MKVYVVTKGEYSDYHIQAIVSSERVAKELVTGRVYDAEDYEEFDLDSFSRLTPSAPVRLKGLHEEALEIVSEGRREEVKKNRESA